MVNKKDLNLKTDEFFKTGNEKYDSYQKSCCPFCGGFNVVKKERGGSSGFFSYTPSEKYKYCRTCHKEHSGYNTESAVREDVIQAILQDALDNKLSTTDMIELLKKAGVRVYYHKYQRDKYEKIRKELKVKEE